MPSTYKYLNLRNTARAGVVDDGADGTYFLPTDGSSVTRNGITFGKGGSTPFAGDYASTVPQISGFHRANSGSYLTRIYLSPGVYTFRLAIAPSGAGATGYAIFDGSVADPVTPATEGTVTGNLIFYSPGMTGLTVGKYCLTNGRLYRCSAIADNGATVAGQTAGPSPSHASGSVVDGGVTWTYIRSALFNSVNASPSGFIDAKGNAWTSTTWSANNVASDPVTVTNPVLDGVQRNYVTGVRTSEAITTQQLSSIGWAPYAAPLVNLTLNDAFNAPISGSPSFSAMEPSGVPLAKIISGVGEANFSIDPTCDLAPYVAIQNLTRASAPGWYVVSNGTPIPDSFVGTRTLKIIQNDSLAANSPYTTTFNVTVVSSGGRTAEKGVRGLISTKAWQASNAVRTVMASRWMGYQGQAIDPSRDVTVTSASDLSTKWNAIIPPAGNTNWYRIKLAGTDYTGNITLNSKDFGSGGLLIEPASGSDPTLNFSSNTVIRGLHLRGLRIINNYLKTNNFTGGFIFGDPGDGAAFYNRVKVEKCRIGTMFEQPNGFAGGTDTVNFGGDETKIMSMTHSGDTKPMFFYHAEHVEFVNNVFDGAGINIYSAGARLLVIEGNECKRATNDFIAWQPIFDYYSTNSVTAFGDNNVYVSIRNNTFHAELDYATYSNGQHGDFRQIRKLNTPTWAANAWKSGDESKGTQVGFAVGDRRLNDGNIYIVSAVTTGKTGSVGPTGTGSGFVDGGVTWDYDRTLYVLNMVEEFSGNNLISATLNTSSGTADRQFYFCNNDQTKHTIAAAVFDNAEASATVYGVTNGHNGTVYAEYNTMIGSPDLDASESQSRPHLSSFTDSSKLLGRNNVFSQSDTNSIGLLQSFNQWLADCTSFAGTNTPGNVLQGTFVSDGSGRAKWDRSALDGFVDGPTKTKAEVDLAMRKQLRPKAGIGAGCSCTIPFTIIPASGYTGPALSTSVTLLP